MEIKRTKCWKAFFFCMKCKRIITGVAHVVHSAKKRAVEFIGWSCVYLLFNGYRVMCSWPGKDGFVCLIFRLFFLLSTRVGVHVHRKDS